MTDIYQVTIRGRKLEGRDLKQLLARAVREKRSLDQRLRVTLSSGVNASSGWGGAVRADPDYAMSALR